MTSESHCASTISVSGGTTRQKRTKQTQTKLTLLFVVPFSPNNNEGSALILRPTAGLRAGSLHSATRRPGRLGCLGGAATGARLPNPTSGQDG